MKTIRIIDLLNKIANGEEVPFKIKYYGRVYDLKNDGCFDYYIADDRLLLDELENTSQLKDIVEILDEEDEFEEFEPTEYADLDNDEKLDYLYDMIRYLIKNQKKIIERLQHENSKDNV